MCHPRRLSPTSTLVCVDIFTISVKNLTCHSNDDNKQRQEKIQKTNEDTTHPLWSLSDEEISCFISFIFWRDKSPPHDSSGRNLQKNDLPKTKKTKKVKKNLIFQTIPVQDWALS